MNLETLIDQLWAIRNERNQLAQQDKDLAQQYNTLKQELIQRLDHEGVNGLKTTKARVTITESEVVSPTDWDAFYDYIKTNDAFYLLQKRPSSTACKELINIQGSEIPGISLITLRDLSLRGIK